MSNIEIERKYFINPNNIESILKKSVSMYQIKQGYLFNSKILTIRLRMRNRYCNNGQKLLDKEAFLTIKGKAKGFSVPEYEYKIPTFIAKFFLKICGTVIEKYRYIIYENSNTWELDIFKGNHKGLIVAEIELKSEDQEFSIPEWFGQYLEVSEDSRFRNAVLIGLSKNKVEELIKDTLEKLC